MNEKETTAWGSGAMDFDLVAALPRLEASMQVRFIATFPFEHCVPDQEVVAVMNDPKLRDFDHIPVREAGHVIGVFNRREKHGPKKYVREIMLPLSEWFLLSADAPLLSFVEKADTRPFCLVLDRENISGIVTISDIQKLPVRPAIFMLVSYLEILLAEWIRKSTQNDDQWLNILKDQQVKKIRASWEDLRERNLVIDMVSATSLTHKIDAAVNLGAFSARASASEELYEVREMRDSIAHAWDFGSFPEQARKVPKRIQLAREYIRLLSVSIVSRNPK